MKSFISLLTVCALTSSAFANQTSEAQAESGSKLTQQESNDSKDESQDKSRIAQTVEDLLSPGPNNRLYKEWLKAKVKYEGKASDTWQMGEYFSFGADIRYRYQVEPAFVKDLHQRFDVYSFSASLGTSALKHVGLGLNLGMQVTFSRLFDSKTDALKSKIYFLNRIPWEHQDVSRNLDDGDAVRIEINSDGSIGKGQSDVHGKLVSTVSAGISRGTRFVIDTYKLKGNKVRLRLIATRNEGTLSLGAALSPLEKFSVGSDLGDKVFKKFLKCNPISANGSTTLGETNPVDTFMVDYVFNLDNTDAQLAYNTVMKTIKKIHIDRHINFLRDEKRLGDDLLRYVDPAEKVFLQDRNKPRPEMGVDRIFKGKTVTEQKSFVIGTACFKMWDNYLQYGSSDTNLRSYNRDDIATDQIYLSASTNTKSEYALGLSETKKQNTINGLFKAKKVQTPTGVKVEPESITDIIFTQDVTDKRLSTSDVDSIKAQLDYAIPTVAQKIDWGRLTEGSSKANGYVRMAFIFNHNTFKELQQYAGGDIYLKLRAFVDNYPEKEYLNTNSNYDVNSGNMYDRFEQDIQEISLKMHKALQSTSHQERLEGFSELRGYELFKALGPGFIASLLPEDKLGELIYFNLNAGAVKGSNVSFIFGNHEYSSIYKTMQYIQAVINDRSFDLRLQLDEKGEFQIYKFRNDPKNACVNCDTTGTDAAQVESKN